MAFGNLFSIQESSGKQTLLAAVRPCVAVEEESCAGMTAHRAKNDMNLSLTEPDESMRRVPTIQINSDTFFSLTRREGFLPEKDRTASFSCRLLRSETPRKSAQEAEKRHVTPFATHLSYVLEHETAWSWLEHVLRMA